MNTTTVLLVVVGLAAVLFLRNGSFAGAAAPGWYGTPPPVNGMPSTVPADRQSATGSVMSLVRNRDNTTSNPWAFNPTSVIEGHTARKDAVAPYVLSRFGVPVSIGKPITDLAGKLDVSGYAENYVSKGVVGAYNGIKSWF